MSKKEYLLGTNKAEIQRLEFQHTVWKDVTLDFLIRIGYRPGLKILDAGAGPGFVSLDLASSSDEITAVEPSALFTEYFAHQCELRNITNIKIINSTVEDTDLPKNYFDLIIVRWVIAFLPYPEQFISKLTPCLKQGGIIAIQDYYYEGLSLYPRGGIFDNMLKWIPKYYASVGGDAYIAAKLPVMLRKNGFRIVDFTPHCLSGGPDSGPFNWAYQFFTSHVKLIADAGIFTHREAEEIIYDWENHKSDTDALFFTPLVVDVAGEKI